MSRRSLSSAVRACSCAWKRLFSCASAFEPLTKIGREAGDDDAQDDHRHEELDEGVALLAHFEVDLDLHECKRGLCVLRALRADAPERLGALVDGDERRQRLGAAPPAELRAGHDPRVLVEPMIDVAWSSSAGAHRASGAGAAHGSGAASRRAARRGRRRRRTRPGGSAATRLTSQQPASRSSASRPSASRPVRPSSWWSRSCVVAVAAGRRRRGRVGRRMRGADPRGERCRLERGRRVRSGVLRLADLRRTSRSASASG